MSQCWYDDNDNPAAADADDGDADDCDGDDGDDDDEDGLTLLVGRAVSHESVVVANLQNKRDDDHINWYDYNNIYDDEHNN